MKNIEANRFIISCIDPTSISSEERHWLKESLPGVPWADTAIDWVLLLNASSISNLCIEVLKIEDKANKELFGLAIIGRYIVDCTKYFPSWLRQASQPFGQQGLKWLCLETCFVHMPMMWVSGLLVPLDTSHEDRASILIAINRFLDQQHAPDIFAYYAGIALDDPRGLIIHEGPGSFGEIMQAEGFIKLNPVDHNILDLRSYRSFDDYLSGLHKKHRYNVRNNMRIFTRNSGHIEPIGDYSGMGSRFFELYCRTRDKNMTKGGFISFAEVNQDVFTKIGSFIRGEKCRGAIARSKATGEVLGFIIGFNDKNYAFDNWIGQSYKGSTEARTYFNLFYWSIKEAIDRHCDYINLAPGYSSIKQRFGAVPMVAPLYFRAKSKPIQFLFSVLKGQIQGECQKMFQPEPSEN
jgi:hypothetical protein